MPILSSLFIKGYVFFAEVKMAKKKSPYMDS